MHAVGLALNRQKGPSPLPMQLTFLCYHSPTDKLHQLHFSTWRFSFFMNYFSDLFMLAAVSIDQLLMSIAITLLDYHACGMTGVFWTGEGYREERNKKGNIKNRDSIEI